MSGTPKKDKGPFKSADDGRYKSADYAKKHPKTTYKVSPKKPKGK